MKTSRTYLFVIFLLCGFGSLLLSCGNWEVPTKKTKRECVPPSGSLTQKAQERKVDFSISDAKGTIDQVIWSFGDGSTSVTTGTTVTHIYPNPGTYTASATLTNTCKNVATSSVVVTAVNIVAPSVSTAKPSNTSVITVSANIVINNYGNPAAIEYGICYSSSSNSPDKNSTVVPVPTPVVGVTTAVNLTNLTPSTTYYYRSYAKLPSGEFVYSSTVETLTTLADPLLQDLIASVSFTDQSLLDVSGYNNHVKLVDNPTFTTDHKGKANSAILLDGVNDYFYMDENSSLNPEALSVSIWFKMSSFTHRMQVYNKSRFSDSAFETYSALLKLENDLGPNTTVMTNIKQNSACQPGKGWLEFPFTSRIEVNTWYHLVFTYSGRTVRMYLNNVPLYTNTDLPNSTMDKCPGAELKFGAAIQGLNWFFHGAMDDIRIYKRALSASEVDALYKQ